MSKHTIAADIAARRKSLAEDSAENVEQIVLGLLQAEDQATAKILSSCGATSVEHLRDKYLEALRYGNQQYLPAEFKSWEEVFKAHTTTGNNLSLALEALRAILNCDGNGEAVSIAKEALQKIT